MAKLFGATAARAIRTAAGKADSRSKMIGAVRAACKRQGIDDELRRQIQQDETGKPSLSEMTLGEIGKVLDRLNREWKGPMGHRAHAGKVRALWWTLYWLGAVEDPADGKLDAFVRRQTGIAALRFLDHRKAHSVIEALKSWAAREGVKWPDKAGDATADRRAVIDALWMKLADLRLVRGGGCASYIATSLNVPEGLDRLGRHELDAAIKLLGKRLRRGTAERGGSE